jgi:hypothetical protein
MAIMNPNVRPLSNASIPNSSLSRQLKGGVYKQKTRFTGLVKRAGVVQQPSRLTQTYGRAALHAYSACW